MRTICKEIKQRIKLETNIPGYFNRLVTLYEQYASINLTMNYYMLYENQQEASFAKSEDEKTVLEEVNRIIKEYASDEFSGVKMEEGIQAVDKLREHIKKDMMILTSYTDIFWIYEYILERVKHRFYENESYIEEDECVAMAMNYIFEVNDNIVINDKIKEIIGELPVRLTKLKYFDLVRNSLSIYKGGERASFDSFLYMLETAATVYKPDGMEGAYKNLAEAKAEFATLDYSNFTKEQYDLYAEKLENIILFITDRVEFYYGLMEVVNYLYTSLLTVPYAYMDGGYRIEGIEDMKYLILPPGQENIWKEIIGDINRLFAGSNEVTLEEAEVKLTKIEGAQEKLLEEILELESTLDEIKASHEELVKSLMLAPIFNCLVYSQNLLSNSLFVELKKEEVKGVLSDADIKKGQDDLITKLSDLFSNSSKVVTRAIMANTINKMPVFFQTRDEIKDYIESALIGCGDITERRASMDIIRNLCGN